MVLVEATNHSGLRFGFEVAVIRTSKPHPKNTHAADYDVIEVYPGNSQWGRLAWSWTHEKIALTHFDFLLCYGIKEDFYRSTEYSAVAQTIRRMQRIPQSENEKHNAI